MKNTYEAFKKNILDFTGINLSCYKEEQMKRRISTLISRKGLAGYEEYFQHIKQNTEEYDEFLSYMTINVSEFYRNPEQWDVLERDIIPELISSHNGNINVWSAACSTGDEPYSLVMLLAKFIPMNRINILATDIDLKIIEKAKSGIYTANSLKSLPTEFKSKYFEMIGNDTYKISESVKSCVTFRQHDLIKDEYPQNIDLIVCRNVLIYFTEQAKNEVYNKFYNAMSDNSTLFIGSTEQVIRYRDIGFDIYKSFFYKKKK